MKRVTIDCGKIHCEDSFHNIFSEIFGFPEFYGKNMNAWIDCMSYIDVPESGMTKITCSKGDFILLELENVMDFKKRCPELYDTLIECSAFVNWRSVNVEDSPLLMLSFYE